MDRRVDRDYAPTRAEFKRVDGVIWNNKEAVVLDHRPVRYRTLMAATMSGLALPTAHEASVAAASRHLRLRLD